jgi:chaperonin GroEL
MTDKQKTPRVVFQPTAHRGVQRGINQIVEAVRPTLGPLPCMVAIERVARAKMPEFLDSGGVIARRIVQLPDRDEDVGAMLVRHMLWHLHEKVGDGTATAAVLFQSVYNQGMRYVVAGGNAMQLRRYLETGMGVILDELTHMAIHLEGKETLASHQPQNGDGERHHPDQRH